MRLIKRCACTADDTDYHIPLCPKKFGAKHGTSVKIGEPVLQFGYRATNFIAKPWPNRLSLAPKH